MSTNSVDGLGFLERIQMRKNIENIWNDHQASRASLQCLTAFVAAVAFTVVFCAMFVALAVTPIGAQTSTPKNEIEVQGIYAIPSGSVDFSTTTAAGSDISFANDFGLKNRFGFGLRFTHRSE